MSKLDYQPGKLPILLVQPYGPVFKELSTKLGQDAKLQVFQCQTSMEVVTTLADLPCAIVLLFASRPEEVVLHTQMLKLIQPQIKKSRVRVVFNTSVSQVKALSLMNYYGTAETINEPIQARAFIFKLQRHIKAVMQENGERLGNGPAVAQTKNSLNSNGVTAARKEENRGPKIRYTDAIGIVSDCWLVSKSQVKQIGKRWVIKLTGPGTNSGVWAKIKGDETAWQWKPHLPAGPTGQDPFVKDDGAWVFRGQRPDFQDDMWWFISNTPELIFLNGSDRKASKMSLEKETGTLILAKDSIHAAKLLPQIRQSVNNTTRALSNQNQSSGAAGARGGASKDTQVEWVSALKIKSDCWLFEEKMPRKINGRWAIRVTGPGPSAGRWIEAKAQSKSVSSEGGAHSADREVLWHWTPENPGKDQFITEKGAWVYQGKQPKFEGDHWLFIADQPSLSFFVEGESYGSKFSVDASKKLYAAKDSQQALAKMPDIRKSHQMVTKQLNKAEAGAAEYGSHLADEGQELEYGKGGKALLRDRVEEVRLPRDAFGDSNGIWEKANAGQKGRVWAVFIPSAWMNDAEPLTRQALKQCQSFDVYKGGKIPLLDVPKIEVEGHTGEWVFQGSGPTHYTSFMELPHVIREFLIALTENGGDAAAARAKVGEQNADAEGDELKSATSAVSPEEIPSNEDQNPNEGTESSIDADTRIENLEAVADANAIGTQNSHGDASSPQEDAESGSVEGESGIGSVAQPLPAMSKIGLLFAAAELCASPQMGIENSARKLARYASRYLREARLEIWIESRGENWVVLATSDGRNGFFKDSAQIETDQPKKDSEGRWIVPMRASGGRGRIVVDAVRQEGQESVKPEELAVVQQAFSGILISLIKDKAA